MIMSWDVLTHVCVCQQFWSSDPVLIVSACIHHMLISAPANSWRKCPIHSLHWNHESRSVISKCLMPFVITWRLHGGRLNGCHGLCSLHTSWRLVLWRMGWHVALPDAPNSIQSRNHVRLREECYVFDRLFVCVCLSECLLIWVRRIAFGSKRCWKCFQRCCRLRSCCA